jgi:hypothetical protein
MENDATSQPPPGAVMCNLYSVIKGQAAIVVFTRALRDRTGNLPPTPGVFPDYFAPVVRNAPDGVRELSMLRWGMPGPPAFGGAPITNIRNVKSPHWRRWLQPESRCVVPFTSFCEYADTKPRKTPTWFALDDGRPLARVRRPVDALDGAARHQSEPGRRRAPTVRLPDHRCECRGRRHPSQGDAGHSHQGSRDRAMETAPADEALQLQRPSARSRSS